MAPLFKMVDFRDKVNKILNHCKKEFGEEATLYPVDGGTYIIQGIFDNEYEAVDPETEQLISANQPIFGVNLFDLNIELKPKSRIKIRNLFYRINEVREDGQGGASLILHRECHGQKVFKKKGAKTA